MLEAEGQKKKRANSNQVVKTGNDDVVPQVFSTLTIGNILLEENSVPQWR